MVIERQREGTIAGLREVDGDLRCRAERRLEEVEPSAVSGRRWVAFKRCSTSAKPDDTHHPEQHDDKHKEQPHIIRDKRWESRIVLQQRNTRKPWPLFVRLNNFDS